MISAILSRLSQLTVVKSVFSQPTSVAVLMLCIAFSLILFSLTAPLMTWVIMLSGCAVIVRVAGLSTLNSLPTTRTVNLLAILAVFALSWF
ncbi:MAG: DUF3488 domain-containing protein, partial [Pseudomonadota bacterium]|nr:DUF3488 domain-containing protein [Pseudomonadota bacterium]